MTESDRILETFRKHRIKLVQIDERRSFGYISYIFRIASSLRISAKRLSAIKAELENARIVREGDMAAVELALPDNPDIPVPEIDYSALEGMPVVLGSDSEGNPAVYDFRKIGHLIIAGCGADNLSKVIASSAGKAGAEIVYASPDNQETLTDELERRYFLIAGAECRNIEEYNSKMPEKLPYILVISDSSASESFLTSMISKGGGMGIHSADSVQGLCLRPISG